MRGVRSSRRCSSTPPRGRNESYVLEPAKLTAAAAAARSRGSGASGSGDPQPRPLSRASGAFPLGELLRSSESAWRPTGGPVRRPGGPACPASGRRCFSAAGTSEWQLPPPPAGHQLRSAALVRGLRGGVFLYFPPGAVIFDLDVDVHDRVQTAGFKAAGGSESVAALPAQSALPGVPGCPAATRFKFAMQKVLIGVIGAGRMPLAGPYTGTAYPEGRSSSSPPAGPWVGVGAVTLAECTALGRGARVGPILISASNTKCTCSPFGSSARGRGVRVGSISCPEHRIWGAP